MPETRTATLEKYLASLPDPRVERTRDHKLLDIVTIVICAGAWLELGYDAAVGFANFDHFRLRILVECAPNPT